MALYKRVDVPMTTIEQFMKHSKSIIGDTLCTQYTKLKKKEISDCNKCWKGKIDVPKGKTNSSTRNWREQQSETRLDDKMDPKEKPDFPRICMAE
ncbi:hypothetical protein PVK06_012665 [Gossypium arboreum]|uniref:Uncharacterized protein n=1 Tax=Gossypium arboreum TaxID=29729 RepID=A0ABR0QC62_GOSAR|nr:hypothetical protein PVK06_012665 [Gossypium arboreum]